VLIFYIIVFLTIFKKGQLPGEGEVLDYEVIDKELRGRQKILDAQHAASAHSTADSDHLESVKKPLNCGGCSMFFLDSFSQTTIMRVLSHLSIFDRVEAVKELKNPVTLQNKNLKREASIKYFLSEISRSLKSIKSEPRHQFRVDRNLFSQAHNAKCSKNTIYIH